MLNRLRPLARLEGDQLRASHPGHHAALSASAGTGKTHVLTARVLRLLLRGADPSSILCLTFTKAGAAEMADRIHARLAYWVRLKDTDLGQELIALGEDPGPEGRARARTLFARVLDAAGGGLRIQTIHAFSQALLAAFPAEAGMIPGFKPLDGREEKQLARQTLADLLVRAETGGNLSLIADVQSLSHRLGEAGAEGFLMQCARAPDAMAALGAAPGIEARLRRAFDLPSGNIEERIAGLCDDAMFDLGLLDRISAANRAWGTATGLKCCEAITAWRARHAGERAAALSDLAEIVLRKDGEMRAVAKGQIGADPDYERLAADLAECCKTLIEMRAKAALAKALAAGLRAGQAFAFAYADAKRAAGAVDFDDLIRTAERLLLTPGMGDWVRYKLDQRTDHILIDEAQDTNERQWNIVRALALEFFAGEGARGGGEFEPPGRRTIFTVGDYKQAIFGFQGTDPEAFEVARAWFGREAEAVATRFLDLSISRSFRSSPAILSFVDAWLDDLGPQGLGLLAPAEAHESHHRGRAGSVTLWAPFTAEGGEGEEMDEGEEGWIGDATRRYAAALAKQIRNWLDRPFLVAGGKRPLRPEDILILVRRRSTLAGLIVARLHAEGVPVAGIDRLLLNAPLAVRDLIAAIRFALQPLDDLNLANLLVSPLFGWTQDALYAAARGRQGALWPHLRAKAGVPDTVEALVGLLGMADLTTPHRFLETILSGPMQGRRKLIERLGHEARDPIEELLAAALDFESRGTPSLQGFLDWFARGDVEIVRDPSAPLDAVRVMTVHGSKGLQAPVVILADATVDPSRKRESKAALRLDGDLEVPVFRPRKDELFEPMKSGIAAQEARDRAEHWRLLYVALTRAEERLYIGGALGPADRSGPPADSWYAAIERTLTGLGAEWRDMPLWQRARIHGETEMPGRRSVDAARQAPPPLPGWLFRPAPEEARPPRPLAPSSIADDDVADPPPSPALRLAAERGKLLHQLFERLPGVPPGLRAQRADDWLARARGVDDSALRKELVDSACAIIADPRYRDLFGTDAFAEAPIAAVTPDGSVISGTADRLLIGKERILVADFKTGHRAPAAPDGIPVPHLRQMAAYVAALEVIFPGKRVDAALLYTSTPVLHPLPAALIDRYRPGAA
ncbi:double-strand break repair helicase AddA [Allosphingosinicella flava]|uniref:DNA 3'-5' helicase n=1 Tax=Allosphingosinicella flava TaxID=2771430 RepID=A0A7T2GKY6_9SPHN|nr:double-strand break repair helicase AddA [Sphingosinicella flava]QPQ55774.1 double-strand break repair helicase AddA [Sphingosinicella flava]